MTAPLNGVLLNGGTPYATWAWGESRISAEAVVEPVVNRVYADARGQSVAESVSTAITDRLAFVDGTKQPYATAEIEATRFATMAGVTNADAEFGATATRLAWMAAAPMVSESVSTGSAERWKILTGEASAESTATLADAAVTRFAMQRGRPLPAQARTWVSEALVDRLRVRQQFGRGTAVCRAITRAIPNSAIGRGVLDLRSEALADNARVNIYHAFEGTTTAVVESIVYSDRVRIIVGGLVGVAEARLAPTITTSEGRFSYNSAASYAVSEAAVAPVAIRRPILVNAVAEADVFPASTYYVRGFEGVVLALAGTALDFRTNEWVRVAAKPVAEAASVISPTIYRARPMAGQAHALAELATVASVLRDPVLGLAAEAISTTSVIGLVSRYVSASATSEAVSTSVLVANRYVSSIRDAVAGVTIEAFGRRGRLMTGVCESEALTKGEGLRGVWAMGYPEEAIASASRFIFRINIDSEAPTRRTVQVPYTDRRLALAASSREYRVT